jgi:hypothetical protein
MQVAKHRNVTVVIRLPTDNLEEEDPWLLLGFSGLTWPTRYQLFRPGTKPSVDGC